MSELIDRDVLNKIIDDTDWYSGKYGLHLGAKDEESAYYRAIDIHNAIDCAPTIEVVRCKDCIYRPVGHVAHNVNAPEIDGVEYRVCPCLCEDSWYSTNPADDFFCAKGSIGV